MVAQGHLFDMSHITSKKAESNSLVGYVWIQNLFLLFYLFIYFKFYFIFKLYNIVLVLPNIEMNPPQVYLCSPSLLCRILWFSVEPKHESAIGIHMSPPFWTSLPSPSLPLPSRLVQSPCLSSLRHSANSHWLSILQQKTQNLVLALSQTVWS